MINSKIRYCRSALAVYLTALFPFQQGYMIFCRDRVMDKRAAAADVMVKRLKGPNADVAIILTTVTRQRQ
jgi:hypothetical protein